MRQDAPNSATTVLDDGTNDPAEDLAAYVAAHGVSELVEVFALLATWKDDAVKRAMQAANDE